MSKKVYKKGIFNSLLPWILAGSLTTTNVVAYYDRKESTEKYTNIINGLYYQNDSLNESYQEQIEEKQELNEKLELVQQKNEIFERALQEEDYYLDQYELLILDEEDLDNFDSIELDFHYFRMSDEEFDIILDKIRAMKNLKTFILDGHAITYSPPQERIEKIIEVIGEKTSLIKLDLFSLGITDITFLENLTDLEEVYLFDQDIYDISVLKNLTNLKILCIAVNDSVTDFTSLKNLTSLESLYLSGKITDASIVSSLTNLKELSIAGSLEQKENLENLTYLESLPQLEDLKISYTILSDITFLEGMPHLKTLDLWHCDLTNIESISALKELEMLSLISDNIQDITPLKDLTNLKNLQLSWNQIEKIDALGNLLNLKTLDLGNNQIQNIDALKNLTQLKTLDLSSNQIESIDALENLLQLEYLYLESNQIKSIDALYNMQNLQTLEIHHNLISNIDALMNLPSNACDSLVLRENPIPDAAIIAFLIAHEEAPISNVPNRYKEAIEIRRALKDVQVLGVDGAIGIDELLTYDTKWLRDYETVILEDNFFELYQTEYNQILKKLGELPHVKYLKIIGPSCASGIHEDIAKLETPENIDKMIETIMMMKELESLDIEFVYGLNNASFAYNLTNLTSIDLSYNGLPDEEVERIHQFINGKQKVYPN